jgi:alkane 1-monooxygenase
MQARVSTYLFVFSTPIVIILSMMMGGGYAYLALGYVFVLVPIVEWFIGEGSTNLDEIASQIAANDRVYDFILYAVVPIQIGILIYFLNLVSTIGIQTYEQIGLMTCYGLSAGALGINVAHELGHRSSKIEKLMSKILLASTLYMHFYIEHNRGHHNRVATDEDPASARFGEVVYVFWVRSIISSWFSAWELEKNRLGSKYFSFKNEMLVFQLIQFGILITVYLIFGATTMLYFVGASLIGILLLETVNYIEHYGLRRKKINEKRYDRTMPIHSWNSDHILGRILLFELTRHSDHHYQSDRKYQVLRHFDESPQMPAGYPTMMLLSMVPPLWFKIMHKRIANYKATAAGLALG